MYRGYRERQDEEACHGNIGEAGGKGIADSLSLKEFSWSDIMGKPQSIGSAADIPNQKE